MVATFGASHFTILPNGDLYACRRMESKVGNIFEKEIYDEFEKCSKCELHRFCRGCPAVTYGLTHNMYAPDPQCWKEID
jgi:radical SAM protein with 4Fe4S-binding SPASM domain